jgi:hypothetical protein
LCVKLKLMTAADNHAMPGFIAGCFLLELGAIPFDHTLPNPQDALGNSGVAFASVSFRAIKRPQIACILNFPAVQPLGFGSPGEDRTPLALVMTHL